MPTNEEVIERFQDLYALKIDDVLNDLIKTMNSECLNILNNPNNSLYSDFQELIMTSSDLNRSLIKKKSNIKV